MTLQQFFVDLLLLLLLIEKSHHAERLVNLKVRAKKTVTDFRYPRACGFRKTKQTNRFRSPGPLYQLFSKRDFNS
jgi:hypothetical protein